MQCTCCGTPLPLTAKFCPECGTAVGIDDTPLSSTAEAIFGIGVGTTASTGTFGQAADIGDPPELGGPAGPEALTRPDSQATPDVLTAPNVVAGSPEPTAAYGHSVAAQPASPDLAATAPFGTPAQPAVTSSYTPSADAGNTGPPAGLDAPTAATESIFGPEPTAIQPQFTPTDADKPRWGQATAAPAGAWVVPPQAPTTAELPADGPTDRRLGPALTFAALIAFWLLGTTAAYLFVDANIEMSRLSNEIFHDVGPLVVGSDAISAGPPGGVWSMVEWVGRYGAWAAAFLLLFSALLRFRGPARILTAITGLFLGANAVGRAVILVQSPIWKQAGLSRMTLTRYYIMPIGVTAACGLVLLAIALAARRPATYSQPRQPAS